MWVAKKSQTWSQRELSGEVTMSTSSLSDLNCQFSSPLLTSFPSSELFNAQNSAQKKKSPHIFCALCILKLS